VDPPHILGGSISKFCKTGREKEEGKEVVGGVEVVSNARRVEGASLVPLEDVEERDIAVVSSPREP
jgi:hypothetical protein